MRFFIWAKSRRAMPLAQYITPLRGSAFSISLATFIVSTLTVQTRCNLNIPRKCPAMAVPVSGCTESFFGSAMNAVEFFGRPLL